MFKKILIANRGEIACRIIRTAHKLGITCVAIYSEADADALHVRLADEAICVGPAPSQESYLNYKNIINAALQTRAEAIHPGYGFLSENADFAEECIKAGLCFIGPPVAAIRAMGSKSAAKHIVAQVGVPLLPGYHEANQDANVLLAAATTIGYPVLLKATAGGGGKGMRVVWNEEEFTPALAAAQREALASFGDQTILLEKYLPQPRHVEVQIFADQQGNYLYLFERDCSIQRRHQKIIEEAPAPGLSKKLREKMGAAAIKAARAIQYIGAGTIEFLLDDNEEFYFMEMNTRLQVEHPVTEMITRQDLVAWQLNIASGEALPLTQSELEIQGHAFEARIYAEDPYHDFLPATGTLKFLKTPVENQHIRIDSGVIENDQVKPFYDPLLSKLIVWDINRESALQRLIAALAEYQIVGVTTNLDLLAAIAKHPAFHSAQLRTDFIAQWQTELLQKPVVNSTVLTIATVSLLLMQQQTSLQLQQSRDPNSPWYNADGWHLNLTGQQTFYFQQDNQIETVTILFHPEHYVLKIANQEIFAKKVSKTEHELILTINAIEIKATVFIDNNTISILTNGERYQLTAVNKIDNITHHVHSHKQRLTAPMPGRVVALLVPAGSVVERGTALAVIEAMKMEHTIHAPDNGNVKEWYFNVGDLVDEGVILLAFEEIG